MAVNVRHWQESRTSLRPHVPGNLDLRGHAIATSFNLADSFAVHSCWIFDDDFALDAARYGSNEQ
jgi:hypothetical protein